MRLKIANLEDRSRQNNIKIRGGPEAIIPAKITPYLQQLFRKLIHSLTAQELLIDRGHRIHKLQSLHESVPRDILACIHFFHTKEYLMRATRSSQVLPEPSTKIALYIDISAAKAQARKAFTSVTSILLEHKIPYKWWVPHQTPGYLPTTADLHFNTQRWDQTTP